MNEEKIEYTQDFETETLSLHSLHYFQKAEEVLDTDNTGNRASKNRNKSLIVYSKELPIFQTTNNFEGILKRLDGGKFHKESKELRSISRDFLKNLDGYLEKKRGILLSPQKEKSYVNTLTINRELENSKKCLESLRKEYKKLMKTHLKLSQNQYKESLNFEKKTLENRIEIYKKETSNLRFEELKRGTKIFEYNAFSKQFLDLEDQICLQSRKGKDFIERLEEIEVNMQKNEEVTQVASENLKKIKELANIYQVKFEETPKELEMKYQILSSKQRLLEIRINKLKDEAPLKCLNLEIKCQKKRIRLLNKVLALETQDFNLLIQSLLILNRGLYTCFEDSMKIVFIEEQIKKMGFSITHSFSKSITPKKKSLEGLSESHPLHENLWIKEKDTSVLHEEVDGQIKNLERIEKENMKDDESKNEDLKKKEKEFEEKIEKIEVLEERNEKLEILEEKNEKLDVLEEKNENIEVFKEENEKINVFEDRNEINSFSIDEDNKKIEVFEEKTKTIFEKEEGKKRKKNPILYEEKKKEENSRESLNKIMLSQNKETHEIEKIPKDLGVKKFENSPQKLEIYPKNEINTMDTPPLKTFNFAKNKEKMSFFETPQKLNEIPTFSQEEKPKKIIENPSFFDDFSTNNNNNEFALNKQQNSRVIMDPNSNENNQKKERFRCIRDPFQEEGIGLNKPEIKRMNNPNSFKSREKKTNIFETEANYFSEFNL